MEAQTLPARPRPPTDAGRPTQVAVAPFAQVGELDLAMLAVALNGEKASELLEGLVMSKRARALEALEQLLRADSRVRQARLSQAFGSRLDAEPRIRALMDELGPELKTAVFERLPIFQRTLFPGFERRPSSGSLGHPCEAWAQRLVKEARG